jgi:hypothetical protein
VLRRILRGLFILMVGAGLIAVVYGIRPDVPVGSATSGVQQPAPSAGVASTATEGLVPTGPTPNAFVIDAVEPISSNLGKATIRPGGAKRLDAGPLRAELAREPRSIGWGDSYAVRLLTSSGQPMAVSRIVLIAHMADGTVEHIAMGALPERGTYRATVPTRRSAPNSLQVRVSYGKQWVQIPVRR